MTLLLRTWNVFHGKTSPPDDGLHLEAIVRLASSDRPAVLFLQEVPAWALERLGTWSDMTAITQITTKPLLGPLGRSTRLGPVATARTSPNSRAGQIVRLIAGGQANAILLDLSTTVLSRASTVLNPRALRRPQSDRLGLSRVDRLKWARERRGCMALRVTLADGRTALLANLHTTAYPEAVAELELEQALAFVDRVAQPEDVTIVAGDFNLAAAGSPRLTTLTEAAGYSGLGPWVDHIVVKGATASRAEHWPDARRRIDGRLLSDHAPLDVRID
jgi:endonuclease/exonuclease/phosphatase family metal-dependent hydrolase